MSDDARASGEPVLLLSFHVDYWNDLGWPDPFSAQAYTERQHAYARVFGASGVYTPQMIVGGRDAFVGSDRARARKGVERALAEGAHAAVSLTARAPSPSGPIDVAYAVTGAEPGAVLNIALVEDGLSVDVPRGENAGRTLRHERVVRAFETVRLDEAPEGSIKLLYPPSVNRAKASIIGYAQRESTRAILGATSAPIE